MLAGRFTGTMCLSETGAGSSLADIGTRAEPQPDGGFRLFGTKMWISGGDHELAENIVHLVLAKIPGGPAGVHGISLFLVPTRPGRPGRVPGRAQRRGAGRGEPQDGLPRHRQHGAQLRRGPVHPGRRGRRGRPPGGRAAPRAGRHVPHDERGAGRGRRRRDGARLHRLPARPRVRPVPAAGPAGRREGPGRAAGADHRAPGRGPDATGRRSPTSEGAVGAGPVLRAAARRRAHRGGPGRADRGPPAARGAHADRQELAVAVVPGRQRPGHPGARRVRLHP